jgi:hypothetical protein
MGVFAMLDRAPVEVTSTLNENVPPPPAVMGTVVEASSVEPRLSAYLVLERALLILSRSSFSFCYCFRTLVKLKAVIEVVFFDRFAL